jgi:hypothetical protein
MPEGLRTVVRRSLLALTIISLAIAVISVETSQSGPPIGSFYYPPGNVPPGPPPNYNQVDTSYFLGTPTLPMPPPDSGGIYVWVDSTGWNIANHIYSQGNSLEQFHGSVLAMLQSPPTPGVNVFTNGFEIFGDTTSNVCYLQNDRWGWYQWSEHLYEIWWDVSTREWQQGSGDLNDFMVINIAGCAIDFNVWSSGHGGIPFDTDQIYLGGNMVQLSSVPGFVDTYAGVSDPYQSQAGSDPTTDPNITIFTGISGTGTSYNLDGSIISGQTYPCGQVLGEDYGNRFMGPFVYEGNGIQFSSACLTDPCLFNNPPVADSPADTTIFVCDLSDICLPGFTDSDPDNNLLSIEVPGGSLSGDTVCFTPVKGANTITMIVTDDCGAADTAVTVVTVNLNAAPIAASPNDTTVFVCDLSQLCLSGFTYSDADGNISSVDVTGGTLNGDEVCFDPVEGTNTITMIVTDDCGAADTVITVVIVNLNEAPVVGSPNDTTIFACDLSQLCLSGFTYSDADGNISSVDVTGGTLNENDVCFDPVEGTNTITIIVTDDCGAADTAITVVTVDLNEAPVASSPNDTTLFVCDLSQLCLSGFTYSDADGNISSVDVTGGTLNGDEVCFDPVEGANTITMIVTDDCGAADTAVMVVTVDLNEAPVAGSPNDTTVFACDLSQLCFSGFTYSDADGNISSVDVIGGTLNGDEVCFDPVEGTNTITMIVTDDCSAADTAVTVVTVNLNSAPSVNCPGDTSVYFTCEVSDVCIGPFSSNDVDGNLDSAFVITDGFSGTFDGTSFCFTPGMPSVYQIQYVATDSCGQADTCLVNVDVQMTNEAPTVQCAGDTSVLVCDMGNICLSGFAYGDVNNNIATVDVDGGTYDNGEVCFAPVVGDNIISLTVTDSCGLTASCTTTVSVSMNSAPVITCIDDTTMVVEDLSEICVDGIEIADVDDNIVSIDVVGGTYTGNGICFMPQAGINEMSIMATDYCGMADTCEVTVTIGYCAYLPGDANADFGVNGLDITLMVNFFKGGPPLPDTCDCRPDVDEYPFFGAGDTNGNCRFNGVDVTYLYNYLVGIVDFINYCPSCPPTAGWVASHEDGQIPAATKFNEGIEINNQGIGKR